MLPSVFKSFSWALGAQIIMLISAILFSVIAARNFGPVGMGILAFYMSLMHLLTPISQWGLTLLLQREILDKNTDNAALLKACLLSKLLFGCIAFLIFVCVALLLRDSSGEVLKIGLPMALVLILKIFGIYNAAYQALKLWKFTFMIALVSVFALILSSLIAVNSGWGLEGLAWSKAIEALMFSIVCLYFAQFLLVDNEATPNSSKEKRTLSYAVKSGSSLAVTGFVVAAYSRVDQLIIAQMLDEESLGLYAVAMQLTMGWWVLGSLFVTFTRPAILANANSKADLDKITESAFSMVVIFGLGVILANFLFGKWVVSLLYGNDFSEVAKLLFWLSPTAMLAAMGGVRTSYMIACRQDNLYLLTTLIGLFIAVLTNLILLPRLGIMGAVISLNLSLLLVLFPGTFLFPSIKHLGWMMLRAMNLIPSRRKFDNLNKLFSHLNT